MLHGTCHHRIHFVEIDKIYWLSEFTSPFFIKVKMEIEYNEFNHEKLCSCVSNSGCGRQFPAGYFHDMASAVPCGCSQWDVMHTLYTRCIPAFYINHHLEKGGRFP